MPGCGEIMLRTMIVLLRLFLVLCACNQCMADEAAKPAAVAGERKSAQQLTREEFNPGGGPARGETGFQGASWSALGRGFADDIMMQARAGIGDKFPVAEKGKDPLFEVILENGTDDHLVLQIVSHERDQKVRVPRDKPVPITVAGSKYVLSFPTLRVAAAPGEHPSSNKVTIFVTRKP
jgi:hypothetical protein